MAGRPGRRTVLVLGAGAAGLAAGRALRAAGLDALVVEARDRTGGRVDTRVDRVLGVPLELGAEFVHGRPAALRALAREAGVALRRIPDRHLRPDGTRLAPASAELGRAQEILALGERDDEPFDRLLARPAVRRRFGDAAAELARSFVEGFYLADPRRASSLALARMTRALDEVGGDATWRPDGGWTAVLAPLVRALDPARSLRLSARVEEIRWRPGAVEVRARGAAGGPLPPIHGDRAVVTFPLGVLKRGAVRFSPALFAKRRALGALDMGPVVKVILRFRTAFWERRGAGALGFLHAPGAAFPTFWTLAPLRAPVLVGWAGGPAGARLSGRPVAAIARAAIASLASALRVSAAEVEDRLDAVRVADWRADPLAGGGYAVFPVGSADAARALAEPVAGTLFFAGEATADAAAAGTVPGAIASGERAAREAIASFG